MRRREEESFHPTAYAIFARQLVFEIFNYTHFLVCKVLQDEVSAMANWIAISTYT